MRKTFAVVGVAVALAVLVGALRADEDDPADGQKPKKVKAEAQVIVLEGDDGGQEAQDSKQKKVRVRVLRPDGKADDERVHVIVADEGAKTGEKETFLGLGVEPVPAALAAQLPDVLAKDQGLLVEHVADDSPAAKAGLKQYDVLVTYGDQKLVSVEQLVKLVRGDKAGREVSLGIVRGGKPQSIKVTLGEREAAAGVQVLAPYFRGPMQDHIKMIRPHIIELHKQLQGKAAPGDKANVQVRNRMLSLSLRTLDGDRLKAEIEYKDEGGETKKWSFEGTRDEIRKELEGNKEMPDDIRDQLLRSLSGDKHTFQFHMPRGFGGVWVGDGDAVKDFDMDFDFDFDFDVEDIIEKMPEDLKPKVREHFERTLKGIERPAQPAPDRAL